MLFRSLKVLEHAGLISRSREAQWRPCRIAPVGFKQADGWLGNFRQFWDESFNRLDGLLEEMKAEEAAKETAKAPPRTKRKVKATREKKSGRTRG